MVKFQFGNVHMAGLDDGRPPRLVIAIHRVLSRNSKVLSDAAIDDLNKKSCTTLAEVLLRSKSDYWDRRNCSICSENYKPVDTNCAKESSNDGCVDDSLALVPVQKEEQHISLFVSELNELKPGWPLLRRATLPKSTASGRNSVKKISVVQWAMQLPNRNSSLVVINSDPKQNFSDPKQYSCGQGNIYQLPGLDGESGAIVPVGISGASHQSSFDEALKVLPKELEDLHEKYSSTCRLFEYQELLAATFNFRPGSCSSDILLAF